MRKWRIRTKVKLLTIVLFLIGITAIAANISLLVNRHTIESNLSGTLQYPITVGPAYYIFPDLIILKDVVIKSPTASAAGSDLVFPKVGIRFSFWKFILKGELQILAVDLQPSTVNYYALSRFLEDNMDEIMELIRNSSANDIDIHVKESLMDFDRKGTPDYVVTELLIMIRGAVIEGAGMLRTDQYDLPIKSGEKPHTAAKGWPLLFSFNGQVEKSGFAIEHFILKSSNLYTKLWGRLVNRTINLNGFVFMDSAKMSSDGPQQPGNVKITRFSVDNDLENIDLYILDIGGSLDLAYPNIQIHDVTFSVNNIPAVLNGQLSLDDIPRLNAKLIFTHPGPLKSKLVFFEKADVHWTSRWADNILETDGEIDMSFVKHKDLSFAPDTVKITLNGLRARLDREKAFILDLSQGSIAYTANNKEHKITLHGLIAAADTRAEGLKIVKLGGPFYNGTLESTVTFVTSQNIPKIMSRLQVHDIDTDSMEEFIVHFAKFNGRLSSTIDVVNTPQLALQGKLTILDGKMTDFDFFDWVAGSFDLPALKAIGFQRATAQFSMNKERAQFYDIRLKTEDVRISGYFNLDHQNLVDSELTVSLSRKLLSGSDKFKPVLKYFDEDEQFLDFDFKMSGNIDAVNFQWLPSEVKDRIQQRIPDFIERMIEKNIDAMMEPAS